MNEPIKDKAPKPAGLLPKNVQSWLIVGVAHVTEALPAIELVGLPHLPLAPFSQEPREDRQKVYLAMSRFVRADQFCHFLDLLI